MLSVLIGSVCGALLFVGGFLTGLWLSKHNTQVIERQLPPEIVKVPEPVYIEKQQPKREETGVRVPYRLTPAQKQLSETDRALQETLLNANPEL